MQNGNALCSALKIVVDEGGRVGTAWKRAENIPAVSRVLETVSGASGGLIVVTEDDTEGEVSAADTRIGTWCVVAGKETRAKNVPPLPTCLGYLVRNGGLGKLQGIDES